MDFVANKEPQIQSMLEEIGISRIEELFRCIPASLLLKRPLVDDGLSEYEGLQHMESIARKNQYHHLDNYLGAGAYEHYVPALVGMICSRSEFLTSYTPYQAEASQGLLQATFEFQSAICALTGMDIANASVYDAASACAESLLMALRSRPDRRKILLAETLHPHYREVIFQYLDKQDIQIEIIPALQNGVLDIQQLLLHLDEDTAAVLVQSPNFLGGIEKVRTIAQYAKDKQALMIVCANPLTYGLFASASEMGCDIAVGDCQPFGLPLQFGGPYAGYIACCKELLRQLPGRIVGETVDNQGKRGFVLTLQAREQHIRREKATSNICTNQSLAAIASLITILWYGKEGIRRLALTNYQRTAYLRSRLSTLSSIHVLGDGLFLNEFAYTFNDYPLEKIVRKFRENGIESGVDLGKFFPKWKNTLLVSVTETKNKVQLDRYFEVLQKIMR